MQSLPLCSVQVGPQFTGETPILLLLKTHERLSKFRDLPEDTVLWFISGMSSFFLNGGINGIDRIYSTKSFWQCKKGCFEYTEDQESLLFFLFWFDFAIVLLCFWQRPCKRSCSKKPLNKLLLGSVLEYILLRVPASFRKEIFLWVFV